MSDVPGDLVMTNECKERLEVARRFVASHPENTASPQTCLEVPDPREDKP